MNPRNHTTKGFSFSDKIKVLHIAPLPPPFGGMRTYFQGLLTSDLSRTCDLRVLKSDLLGKYKFRGLLRIMMNLMNALLLVLMECYSLCRFNPSIVHIQTNSFGGFYEKSLLAMIARLFSCKAVLHLHGGGFRSFYQESPVVTKGIIKLCLKLSNYIIVATPQMRETLLMIGVSPGRIKLFPNAVHLPRQKIRYSERPRPNEGVTVLFLNRIDIKKGLLELLETAEKIYARHPEVKFRVVGEYSGDYALINDRIAGLGLKNIELVGQVDEKGKEQEFLGTDIYVLPSHVEDLPYGLMEAMSFGVPCVVSAVGGIPSLITSGDNGLLIKPKDVSGLTRELQRLISDAQLRNRIGNAARKTIETRFNWNHRALEMAAFYTASTT